MKTAYKILLIIAALLIFSVVITKCKNKKADNINTEVTTSDLRRYLLDSIQSTFNERLINSNDSIKQKLGIKIQSQQASVISLKNTLSKQKNISDSLKKLIPNTDTLCLKVITAKQAEIDTLNAICDTLEAETINYSKQLFLCENNADLLKANLKLKMSDLDVANRSIEQLKKSNKRNWFERNAIWIGIIGGGIGTALLIK